MTCPPVSVLPDVLVLNVIPPWVWSMIVEHVILRHVTQ
jgi:hypothetical protein